jgi:hypothetical protein
MFSGAIQCNGVSADWRRQQHALAFVFDDTGNIAIFSSLFRRNLFKNQLTISRQTLGVFLIALLNPSRHAVSNRNQIYLHAVQNTDNKPPMQ